MRAALVQRTILSTRGIMVPPLTLCAYMKKGPNLRWSLIQCSGGDEGDRTPDLLTASQALSQLSYAPVRRSTIRELGRRCKDIFGKLSGGAGAGVPRGRDGGDQRPRGRCGRASRASWPLDARLSPWGAPRGRRRGRRPPIRLHSGRPRGPRHETGPSTTFGRHPPTMASRVKIKPQVDDLRFSRNTGYGRGVGVKRSRWAGFVAAASQAADRGRPSNDRFPASCIVLWLVTPFPPSFAPWFCTYSAIPSASKDFSRSHQAARHR